MCGCRDLDTENVLHLAIPAMQITIDDRSLLCHLEVLTLAQAFDDQLLALCSPVDVLYIVCSILLAIILLCDDRIALTCCCLKVTRRVVTLGDENVVVDA